MKEAISQITEVDPVKTETEKNTRHQAFVERMKRDLDQYEQFIDPD